MMMALHMVLHMVLHIALHMALQAQLPLAAPLHYTRQDIFGRCLADAVVIVAARGAEHARETPICARTGLNQRQSGGHELFPPKYIDIEHTYNIAYIMHYDSNK
jgi:hypothetical protein